MTSTPNNESSEFWRNRYRRGETGWDIGFASTPLVTYFQQLTNKQIKILIPGCGNGYEAEWLSENGFTDVSVIDIAEEALERLKAKKMPGIKLILGDFFNHRGQYDLIVEQTFFCALNPILRKAYVSRMHELLKPGGKIIGVLFNRVFEGGPPFGGSKDEYLELFSSGFTVKYMEPCYNSIKPRKDSELFFVLERV